MTRGFYFCFLFLSDNEKFKKDDKTEAYTAGEEGKRTKLKATDNADDADKTNKSQDRLCHDSYTGRADKADKRIYKAENSFGSAYCISLSCSSCNSFCGIIVIESRMIFSILIIIISVHIAPPFPKTDFLQLYSTTTDTVCQ